MKFEQLLYSRNMSIARLMMDSLRQESSIFGFPHSTDGRMSNDYARCQFVTSIWFVTCQQILQCTVGRMTMKSSRVIRSSARSLACTAHPFDSSALLARSAALTHSLLSSWDSGLFLSSFQSVKNHCEFEIFEYLNLLFNAFLFRHF